jgi:hypothetical protein
LADPVRKIVCLVGGINDLVVELGRVLYLPWARGFVDGPRDVDLTIPVEVYIVLSRDIRVSKALEENFGGCVVELETNWTS